MYGYAGYGFGGYGANPCCATPVMAAPATGAGWGVGVGIIDCNSYTDCSRRDFLRGKADVTPGSEQSDKGGSLKWHLVQVQQPVVGVQELLS